MSNNKSDFWVGLFVLIGLLALVFLSLRAGNLSTFSFAPTYTLHASFDNIGGLKVRAPIKSSGVVVGRVVDIGFDTTEYRATATLEIDQKFLFPDDSSASILTSGLLGEQYIGLTPGGSDEDFKDGNKITYTQSAVVLEDLISKFLYSKASD